MQYTLITSLLRFTNSQQYDQISFLQHITLAGPASFRTA
jgi:hypothetical protein